MQQIVSKLNLRDYSKSKSNRKKTNNNEGRKVESKELLKKFARIEYKL